MALDDFAPAGPERDEDPLEAGLSVEGEGEDLFDFPVVEMRLELPEDEVPEEIEEEIELPADVVAAAADLADELDIGFDDDFEDDLSVLEVVDDSDDEIVAADLPEDFEYEEEIFEFDDLLAEEAVASVEAPQALDDPALVDDFDQIIPSGPSAIHEPLEAEPEDEIPLDELASDIFDEPTEEFGERGSLLAKLNLPALSNSRAVWTLMALILFFNGVTALLGFYAVSVFSSGIEGMNSNLADSLHQIQAANARTTEENDVETDIEDVGQTGDVETVVPVETPEQTELNTARAELDAGRFREARQRLFRLLATADSPLLVDGKAAEAEASLMIAESYALEAEAMKENPR